MHTHPSLQVRLQAVDKPKHRLSGVHITILSIPFRKTINILSDAALLCPFGQSLVHLEHVVRGLEIAQQYRLQPHPPLHITLDEVPGVRLPFQQTHSNLSTFLIVPKIYQVEVDVQLVDELAYRCPIHLAVETRWQVGADGRGKGRGWMLLPQCHIHCLLHINLPFKTINLLLHAV